MRVDRDTFLGSAYYNDLWRPAEILEQLLLVVREANHDHGVMFLYRAPGDAPFASCDLKMLAPIAGFVAHGMTCATLAPESFAESDDRALFVVGVDGSIKHTSTPAQRLLLMALIPRLCAIANWRGLREPVPELTRLCASLAASANDQVGQPPPVLRFRNPSGEFVFRAYWCGSADGFDPTNEIAITIERRVPLALALRRRIEELPLTAREKQFCLLLARDSSRQDLADAMGVAVSTAITHQRSVYAKLGVHSRLGLLEALSATGNGRT